MAKAKQTLRKKPRRSSVARVAKAAKALPGSFPSLVLELQPVDWKLSHELLSASPAEHGDGLCAGAAS